MFWDYFSKLHRPILHETPYTDLHVPHSAPCNNFDGDLSARQEFSLSCKSRNFKSHRSRATDLHARTPAACTKQRNERTPVLERDDDGGTASLIIPRSRIAGATCCSASNWSVGGRGCVLRMLLVHEVGTRLISIMALFWRGECGR